MDFKDKWRGMQVPSSYRHAFFRWDNASQQELELDARTVLAILEMVPETGRSPSWFEAERAVLDAPLLCQVRKPSGIPNNHGFPHWDELYPHQQVKANKLSLSEKDFRDYDPEVQARSGKEWEYANPICVMQDVLAHQSRQTAVGRCLAWANRIEGFWGGVICGTILVMIFCWIWGHINPTWPAGMSAHDIEIQKIVNPYYYSSWQEHAIGKFWGSIIMFVIGFAVGSRAWGGSTRLGGGAQ